MELSVHKLGAGADADRQHLHRAGIRATSCRSQRLHLPRRYVLSRVRGISSAVDEHTARPRGGYHRSEPISGVAPYWRVAFEPHFGDHWWEIGTFGLASKVVPMRMSAAGTDSFTDIGVDTQYQYLGDPHTVTVRAAWIHENHNTSASQWLGLADNSNNQLRSLNASASYIYDHTWSLTAGRVSVGGTADATLYGTFSGSPNSAGWIFELAYLPFSHGGPAFWPWLNFRIGLHTRTGPNSMGRPQISTVWEETPAATIRSLHTSGLCSDSPRLRRLSPAHAQSPGEQLRRLCRSRGQDVRLAVGTAEQSTRVAASSGRAAHWPCQGRQDKIGLQGEESYQCWPTRRRSRAASRGELVAGARHSRRPRRASRVHGLIEEFRQTGTIVVFAACRTTSGALGSSTNNARRNCRSA